VRQLGLYRHTTLSTHLYERNVVHTYEKLHDEPEEISYSAFSPPLARPDDTAFDLIQRVRRLPYVDRPYFNNEHWYRDALGISSGAFIARGARA